MNPENKKTSRGGTRAGKPRTPLTPRQKALRIACLVLAILAAVLVTVFAAYRLLVVKPSLPEPGAERPDEDQNYEFGEGPRLSGDRKEEFYTFLLVGRDTGGGGNTDTLMVMAYDIPNQTLNVMSIPRDTMVNVPWDIKRINSVYNYAPYYDKDGIQFLKEEVSYLIGFQPDYTIVVEWEAVGELVDAIGGVEFDVPIDMNYDDPTQNLHIHLNAGLQDIDGDKAMQLLRWRKNSDAYGNVYGGYPNGDLGRIETQQAFLKAVIEKCLNSISLGTIPKMAQIFLDNVDTNGSLTVNNLAWFAKEAIVGGLSMENVHFMTLPNRGASVYSRTYHNYQSYVTPIPDEMLELVNTCFNPYLEDIELNELDLMQVNEDGSLSSTRGHVEDTKATKPPREGELRQLQAHRQSRAGGARHPGAVGHSDGHTGGHANGDAGDHALRPGGEPAPRRRDSGCHACAGTHPGRNPRTHAGSHAHPRLHPGARRARGRLWSRHGAH